MENITPDESKILLNGALKQFNKDLWENPNSRQLLAIISDLNTLNLDQDTPHPDFEPMIDLSNYPITTIYIQFGTTILHQDGTIYQSIDEFPIANFDDQPQQENIEEATIIAKKPNWHPVFLPETIQINPTKELAEIAAEHKLDPNALLEPIINAIHQYYWQSFLYSVFNTDDGILDPLTEKTNH